MLKFFLTRNLLKAESEFLLNKIKVSLFYIVQYITCLRGVGASIIISGRHSASEIELVNSNDEGIVILLLLIRISPSSKNDC